MVSSVRVQSQGHVNSWGRNDKWLILWAYTSTQKHTQCCKMHMHPIAVTFLADGWLVNAPCPESNDLWRGFRGTCAQMHLRGEIYHILTLFTWMWAKTFELDDDKQLKTIQHCILGCLYYDGFLWRNSKRFSTGPKWSKIRLAVLKTHKTEWCLFDDSDCSHLLSPGFVQHGVCSNKCILRLSSACSNHRTNHHSFLELK